MSALSDLVKYAQLGDVRYIRGDHDEPYARAYEASRELLAKEATIAAQAARIEALTQALEPFTLNPQTDSQARQVVRVTQEQYDTAAALLGAGTRAEVEG